MEIAEAKKQLKRAAAALMVKRDETRAEVAALEEKAAQLADGEARAQAAGEAALLAEVRTARGDVEERLALQRDLLATLEHDLSESLRELEALDGVASEGERARLMSQVARLTGSDPFAISPEARALENARDGIAELEARLEVEREMAADADSARDLERRLAALDREDRDAAARAELEALKAKRRGAAKPEPSAEADASDDPAPSKRPKRTL